MRRFLTLILLVAGSICPTLAADNSKRPTKTDAEAASFHLSMEKVKSTMSAYANIMELLAHDPKLLERWKAEAANVESSQDSSQIGEISARVSGFDRRLIDCFTKAGTSPKEAGMTMQTVAGALVGLAMADNTDLQKLNLEKGMARDNIDFVRAYKTEIMEQMEQFRTLQEKYPSVSFDSESK